MSTATITPAVDPRAHYERMLNSLLDRSDPNSPNYSPEFAAGYQEQARVLSEALAQMDQAREAQPAAAEQPPIVPPAPEPHPRESGRFTHGNPGGPGRPPKIRYVEHDVVAVVANAISPLDLHELTQVAVGLAKAGNNNAFRWLNQMLFRHCRTSINQVAALQASGLSDDEHRWALAEQHFGKVMEARGQGTEHGDQGSGIGGREAEMPTATEMPDQRSENAVEETEPKTVAETVAETVAVEKVAPEMPAIEPIVVEAPARTEAAAKAVAPPTPTRSASDVLEVRLVPRAAVPPAETGATKNGNKRSKTVENGRNGRPAHSQVA